MLSTQTNEMGCTDILKRKKETAYKVKSLYLQTILILGTLRTVYVIPLSNKNMHTCLF